MKERKNTLALVNAEKDYLVSIRRDLHKNPESSLNEFRTAKIIEEELNKFGIATKRIGETGVLGIIHGEKTSDRQKTILLRADIDALQMTDTKTVDYKSQNSCMHSCGHDVHTAALLGAAKILQQNRDLFAGEIRLMFQQAEEIGYGAKVFIEEGCLSNVDRTFGLHVTPDFHVGTVCVKPGENNASVDYFKIKIQGRSAHITSPEKATDALKVASKTVVLLHELAENALKNQNVLIGIGKMSSGTAYNIISDYAEIEGTVRAFSEESRKSVINDIINIVFHTSTLFGAASDIEWKKFTSPLINDIKASEEVQKVVTDLFGAESLITDRKPSLVGDDFAELILVAPGAYAYVGSRNDFNPNTAQPPHSRNFDVDENSLVVGAALHVEYAIRFLNGEI